MKTKLISMLAATALCAVATSCSSDEPGNKDGNYDTPRRDISLTRSQQEIIEGQNAFAFQFLNNAIENAKPDENVVCSPLSAQLSLVMLANGASDESRHEILKLLGYSDLQELNQAYQLLSSELPKLDPGKVSVDIANAAWINSSFADNSAFRSAIAKEYPNAIFDLDFQKGSVTDVVNGWVAKQTNNLLPQILDSQVDPNRLFVLANALVFNGRWTDEFLESATRKEGFRDYNDELIGLVDMMNGDKDLDVSRIEGEYCWRMDYGNRAFGLYLMCSPNNKEIVEKLASDKSFNLVKEFNKNIFKTKNCNVKLPKIDIACNPDVNEVLKNAGLDLSEFRAISSTQSGISAPSVMIQKNRIIMQERGTVAASATVVTGVTATNPGEAFFRSPYIFFIAEQSTGVILYAAHIVNPCVKRI